MTTDNSFAYAVILLNLLFTVSILIMMIPVLTLVYRFYGAFKERNKILRENQSKGITVVKVEKRKTRNPRANNPPEEGAGQQKLSHFIHPMHYKTKSLKHRRRKNQGRMKKFSTKQQRWSTLSDNEDISLDHYTEPAAATAEPTESQRVARVTHSNMETIVQNNRKQAAGSVSFSNEMFIDSDGENDTVTPPKPDPNESEHEYEYDI